MIVFLHGWPDSNKLWEGVIDSLEQTDKDALKVAISYPNYDKREDTKWDTEFSLSMFL